MRHVLTPTWESLMAALRPLVLVFQEFESVSIPAAVPSLNTIIVGPAYHCRDYPEDSDNIGAGNYGSLTAENDVAGGGAAGIPVPGSDAIIVSDPPDNAVGAELVENSLSVWMENVHLQIVEGTGDFTPTAPDENLFTSTSGDNFEELGVRPGDRFVTTNNETVAFIIQEVGGYDGSSLSTDQLRMTTNYTTSGVDINGDDYTGGQFDERSFRVERVLDSAEMSDAFVEVDENEITIKGGLTYLYDVSEDGIDQALQVNYAEILIAYCSLRQDLALINEIDSTDDVEAAVGAIDERNPLAVGLFVALQNTNTPIRYIGIQSDSINGAVDRLTGYTDVLPELEARKDLFAIVPLTSDTAVLSAYLANVVGLATPEKSNFRCVIGSADTLPTTRVLSEASTVGTTEEVSGDDVDIVVSDHPESFSDAGVRSGDTFYLVDDGSGREGGYEIEEVLPVGDGIRVDADLAVSAGAGAEQYYILRGTGEVDRGINLPVTPSGSDEILSVEAVATDVGKVIRLDGGDDSPVGAGNKDFLITAVSVGTSWTVAANAGTWSDTTIRNATILNPVVSTTDNTIPAVPVNAPATVVSRQAFRQVLDVSATFLSDGVISGDILEVPLPPADTAPGNADFDSVYTAVVNTVLSENRVLLVPGTDIPIVDTTVAQIGDLGYRVIRNLSKFDQVAELVAIPSSFDNKRLTIVFPDRCTIAGVQNNQTGVQSRQPGYYLSCAVGGMSAGLPPHQGFTNIGIAGISEVHNSSRYFSEDQLEELSNSGYYLFVQDTQASIPYCLHQLTTDVTSLESGEFSFVKNFDFVSRFYKDIADDFLGKYNVIDEVLDVLREAINGGTEQLLTRKFPRIGTPILSATIDRIEVLDGSKDRVEIFLDAEFPYPLNRIGLHIRA